MFIKALFLTLFLFISNAFAHAIPGIKLEAKKVSDNEVLITANFKKSGRALVGNKVKFISMIDNKVLFEGKMPHKGLVTQIPKESYWVFLIVRDNDVVIDGPAPTNGFEIVANKEPKALLYTASASFAFILLAVLLLIKNKREKKVEESY